MLEILTSLRSIGRVLAQSFNTRFTTQYPDRMPTLPPRWRGRIVLTRDPDGQERCVACYLCAAACPVDCIALQATEDETGRRGPAFFRINFSRCIFCGFCEEACPKDAIYLSQTFAPANFGRKGFIYKKEDLLIPHPVNEPEAYQKALGEKPTRD